MYTLRLVLAMGSRTLFVSWEVVLYSYPTKLQSDIPLSSPPVSHSRVTLRKGPAINLSIFGLNTKGVRQLFDIRLKLQSVLMFFPCHILSIKLKIHFIISIWLCRNVSSVEARGRVKMMPTIQAMDHYRLGSSFFGIILKSSWFFTTSWLWIITIGQDWYTGYRP